MKIFISIIIALVVGFLVGFIPLSLKNSELVAKLRMCGDNLKNVYERLEIAENSLGAQNELIGTYKSILEKNYGVAQKRISSSFEKAKPLAEKGIEPYVGFVARRDSLIAAIAKGDRDTEPNIRAALISLYLEETK